MRDNRDSHDIIEFGMKIQKEGVAMVPGEKIAIENLDQLINQHMANSDSKQFYGKICFD